MKRFYKAACVRRGAKGEEVLLDDRPVRTSARRLLALPTLALAEAVAAEWNAQGGEVKPLSMPLTGLANAAIDRVAHDKDGFAAGLAAYGDGDLLCYRAEGPASLVARQSECWDPLLAWARRRYDVDFAVVTGIVHRSQPTHTFERLSHEMTTRDAFELAALAPLVTISGSLVLALALAEDSVTLDTAWAAATLDEKWQAEQWGEDCEATSRLEARRAEFEAGYRFLSLLK